MKKLSHHVMRTNLLVLVFGLTVGACAGPQLLPDSPLNPASVQATESKTRSTVSGLEADETSRAIAARLKETSRPIDKPGTGHGDHSTGIHSNAEQPQNSNESGAAEYTCPMHPEVVQNKSGKCPICGMKLVEKS